MTPPKCTRLDVRDAASAGARPYRDAVNIPWSELAQRTHELPPPGTLLPVLGPVTLAAAAVAWLRRAGRCAIAADDEIGAARDEANVPPHNNSSLWAVGPASLPASAGTEARPTDAASSARPYSSVAADGTAPRGRLWEPAALVAEAAAKLTPGRALDLGCGCGRDAVYLATAGWRVTAVDVLPDALARGAALAARYGAAHARIRWHACDLEAATADDAAANTVPGGPYELVVLVRYLHRPLLARLAGWLRPGGVLIAETFTPEHRARHGKPAGDRVLPADDWPALLPGFELQRCDAAWRHDAHLTHVWATARREGT